MKKLRILALVVLVLCFALLLVSCSTKELNVKQVFKKVTADEALPTLTKADKLDVAGNAGQVRGALVLFTDGATQTVYNVALGRTVGTFTGSATEVYDVTMRASDEPGYDIAFFIVEKITTDAAGNDTYQTTLYAADGTSVASVSKAVMNFDYSFDLVLFNGKCYRVAEDGAMTEACAWSEMAGNLPNIFSATKKYYYVGLANGFAVMNRKLETVSYYTFPDYAEDIVASVLSNGNVFVQYQVRAQDTAEKFDFIEEVNVAGETKLYKYDLVQQVVSAKKGTAKNVKTGYYLDDEIVARNVQPFDQDYFAVLEKSIENIAYGYKIEDKRISDNFADMVMLSLTDGGKAESILNHTIEGQVGAFRIVAEDTIRVQDIFNHQYLYNAKGKLIGDVTGAQTITDTYVVGQGKIYDLKLNEVYDYATEGYAYEGALKSAVLFSKDVGGVQQNYLFKDGAMAAVANSGNSQVLNERLFVVIDNTTGKYFYYNDAGTMILQATGQVSIRTSTNNDAYLVSFVNTTGATEYYRLG